ncbi:unnamed protein product [Aphanomyces euteiches]|uniref:Uncharacterized protein n=1 Tax=Aphanomyces euteiches TaxID=100861 RepID=A0A6G0W852_9STRA|nr:hypothetical protein Ae201684_017620 [Aphanomyces euteiches]KAH9075952.1 hypothetical protein Ae201684P_012442 [Aphanomyces euteiches]KAH9144693.1 hypothetical protein AeRB84_011381 [Aphanomyces euteiches]
MERLELLFTGLVASIDDVDETIQIVRECTTHLFSFVAFLDTLPGPFPRLRLPNLKNVLAQYIVWVTAIHNHVGTLAEYVSDPAFVGSSWVEGEMASRPGDGVRYALLTSITGFEQPSILEDFSHVMLDVKRTTMQSNRVPTIFKQDVEQFFGRFDKLQRCRPRLQLEKDNSMD